MNDIVMVRVSQNELRPFYNLAKLLPSKVIEGVNDIEVIFAKGSPREVRVIYSSIKKSDWRSVEHGEDYYMEDGVASYFRTPPSNVVWFEGCLFRRVKRVLSNGRWR